ncbi:MAG TPA: superoxide dismutase family protein [Sphingomicrobium sp.]|jgi:Cu-Zn family superoxide dismutase|nr:superoxide dismutase family protein [Sphingomicrobium sp.]
MLQKLQHDADSGVRNLALAIALVSLSACAPAVEPTGGAAVPLIDAAGQSIGTVRAWQTAGGLSFHIAASGLPHGLHGVHVHSVGRCDPPDFASAGAHWNPAGKKHGLNNPAGPHAGDLPNVEVAANGVLRATVTLPGASMTSLLDADGAALVIHAAADDYMTDPSGNSGVRIACAVIQPVAEIR